MTTFLFLAFVETPRLSAQSEAEVLYEHCATCHGAKGEGDHSINTPSIAGLPDWYIEAQLTKFMTGARGAHPEDYTGLWMRPMARHLYFGLDKLDDEEHQKKAMERVKTLATHISKFPIVTTKQYVKGNPLKGEMVYNQICIACHGPDAKGVRATNAPSLVHLDDWYMLSQLKKFKAGIRGGNVQLDPIGATMVPMVSLLENEQAMADVVSYVKALEQTSAEGAK